MVCAEHTIGLEIILAQPMVFLHDVGQVETHFATFGDSVISMQDRCMSCTKRPIGSEIILDAPDCTPI
jgi:hypothetical protein